jgi:hypothetical protein
MSEKIDLSNQKTQFYIGLVINICFLLLLYSFKISFNNIQVPAGDFKNNIWQCSDVMTYVDPATNFLKYHVFGEQNTPDHFRTIGYPALISFFIFTGGKNWLLMLQLFQALVFALIYPLITGTLKIMMPAANRRLIVTIFILLLISGTYFTRTPVLLTDTLFTFLFIAGFYYGLKSYKAKKFRWILSYLLLIALAALVRPTLSLYPVLNLAVGYYIARKYALPIKSTLQKSILLSVILAGLINISSVRNYHNFHFFSPSDVMGKGAFNYLVKKVLESEKRTTEYRAYVQQVDSIPDLMARTKLQKAIMFRTIARYPASTFGVFLKNTNNVFLSNNIVSGVANYFGYEWKKFKGSCYPYKISTFLMWANYFLMLLYALLWVLFFMNMLFLLKKKDYETFIVVILLFIMFIIPGLLIGDGGSRFRLTFEHILFIYGLSVIFNAKPKTIHVYS